MRNIKLTIAYDGSKYAGWQIQEKSSGVLRLSSPRTIQGEVEKALRKIFRKKIPLIGSGRTDAGVHAIAQTANFRIDHPLEVTKIKNALNGLLPGDIAVTKAEEARSAFHARFLAKSKTYRYVIVQTPEKMAFLRGYGLQIRSPLDLSVMRKEAGSLLGRHDFSSFQGRDRVKRNAMTTILDIEIKKRKGLDSFPFLKDLELVMIDIRARGFLRGMVRNIVGTLVEAGKGRLKRGDLKKILKKKDRRAAGPCAPGKGLYLLKVHYE